MFDFNKNRIVVLTTFVIVMILNTFALGANQCLKYEPVVVELTGIVQQGAFPGPPNYESVERGDKPEICWVLHLPKSVCVNSKEQDEINTPETNIDAIQLILHDDQKDHTLPGKQVKVKGTLFHAISGHHHTKMLLNVVEMTPEK